MGRIAGVLWDNDGVLVDTEPLYFAASRETLARVGIELSREQFVDISLGRGASVFELALERGVDPEHAERLRLERNARYAELLAGGVPARPGIPQLLARLTGRARMAIVTSSLREHFESIHAQTGILRHFEFALAREDYAASKPDPEPYATAARRIGLQTEALIAVEDTERGLASARAAGVACIVMPNDLNGHLPFDGAERVVRSVDELGEALETLLP